MKRLMVSTEEGHDTFLEEVEVEQVLSLLEMSVEVDNEESPISQGILDKLRTLLQD